MIMCSRCKKRMAVVFVSGLNGDISKQEGLCIPCAKELGINPLSGMAKQMGMSEEDVENMTAEMEQMMQDMAENGEDVDEIEEDDDEKSLHAINPMDFINRVFGSSADKNGENKEADSAAVKDDKKAAKEKKKADKKKKALETYGTNLTQKAAEGNVDPIIGRDKEIERVIQILNRRTKNNPVLLGDPGVGKTMIAEGIAQRIVEKKVPAKLLDHEVYLLDFAALVAGTQFRGQFESRLKKVIEETKALGNIILVIDEIHNIVGAGNAEGAMNAANILKPSLARGEVQIIGATTLDEYRKNIEKDGALERRFQPVMVKEPSVEDTIEILRGIKSYYEMYHGVKIPDDVLVNAVKLSERYITDRFLPDKAIDVIDEACSKENLQNKVITDLAQAKKELDAVHDEQDALAQQAAESGEGVPENYQKIADLRISECQLQDKVTDLTKQSENVSLTNEDVAAVIEMWTGIPVESITETESDKLLHLEDRLSEGVVGQKKAINAVAKAIRRKRAGIYSIKRPVSFIFVGPTGVGKTELVKQIARVMFNSEEALIRLDMSEYMEKHSVSKLIGSPPGYVGYDEAGQFTEKVRRNPYSVILLDEIEKAHADVFNILLQILDDGRITDSHGKTVNFENTIIIMTSNVGSGAKASSLGFANTSADDQIAAQTDQALKELFRPEFLNRIDEIIHFSSLSREELKQVMDLMLKNFMKGLREKGIEASVSDSAKELVLQNGYDEKYGARPLRRAISRYIEDEVAQSFIKGDIKAGDHIKIVADDNQIRVEKQA